jgi:hypothetical protein
VTWRCTCDARNDVAARYCEACGKERPVGTPVTAERTGSGMAWSPPTPTYVREAWRDTPRTSDLPADLAGELSALKAKLGSGVGSGAVLDPAHVARYLAKCAAKKKGETT